MLQNNMGQKHTETNYLLCQSKNNKAGVFFSKCYKNMSKYHTAF